jgi:hypothetical protein
MKDTSYNNNLIKNTSKLTTHFLNLLKELSLYALFKMHAIKQ